jgi:hypothetical protein
LTSQAKDRLFIWLPLLSYNKFRGATIKNTGHHFPEKKKNPNGQKTVQTCLVSLVIREKQIKPTRCHFTSIRLTKHYSDSDNYLKMKSSENSHTLGVEAVWTGESAAPDAVGATAIPTPERLLYLCYRRLSCMSSPASQLHPCRGWRWGSTL